MRVEGYTLGLQEFTLSSTTAPETKNQNRTKPQAKESGKSQFAISSIKLEVFVKRVEAEMVSSLLEILTGKRVERGSDELFEGIEIREKLEFSTKAIIKTDDKEVEVDISFLLSKRFVEENKIDVSRLEEKKEEFVDPLIISLEGSMPKISSDETFRFDIDNDGEIDQISMLYGKNGFLALDKNGDGKINNGGELFGPKSGNGFEDLKAYDSDKNGWIDDKDPIFKNLRVWLKTPTEDRLVALGEVGIGAIHLWYQETPFTYQDLKGAHAQLRSSGRFLFEDGRSGAVSQVDFAKKEIAKNQEKLIKNSYFDGITKAS